jgi:hypothetical protein
MAVGSIGKPAGMTCAHASDRGCAIYEQRPAQCRSDFFCLWMRDRQGLLGDEHRPDRIGIVLTDYPDGDGGREALAAREVWPGAAERPGARLLIEHLRQFVRVTVVPAQDEYVDLSVSAFARAV